MSRQDEIVYTICGTLIIAGIIMMVLGRILS